MTKKHWMTMGFLGVAAVLAIGCGAAPDESVSQNDQALGARLPEARCSLIAGTDPKGFAKVGLFLSVGGGGVDGQSVAFENLIYNDGGSGSYTARQSVGGSAAWYVIDVSYAPSAAKITSDVDANTAAPISAGYFACTYNWGDFELPPNGKKPYAPRLVVAYDPRSCTTCPI